MEDYYVVDLIAGVKKVRLMECTDPHTNMKTYYDPVTTLFFMSPRVYKSKQSADKEYKKLYSKAFDAWGHAL